MAELKTKRNNQSVDKFLEALPDEQQRADAQQILKLMEQETGERAVMWGTSIIGFGYIHLKYESGRELDWFVVGFSPRKQNFSIYFCDGLQAESEVLQKLGKHSLGKGCLYIKKLADINISVLGTLIKNASTRKNAQ